MPPALLMRRIQKETPNADNFSIQRSTSAHEAQNANCTRPSRELDLDDATNGSHEA